MCRMRVLVTTTGSAGHFGPLIPYARAVQDAGGSVLVATRESTVDAVRAAGFAAWPYAEAPAEARGPIFGRAMGLPHDEANLLVVREVFARLDTPPAVPAVLAACERWQPDVVVSETGEFAGGLVAEHLGLPRVRVGISLAGTEAWLWPSVAPALEAVRAQLGLAPDPDGAALTAPPYFTLTPAALDDPVEGVQRFREEPAEARPLPDWWAGMNAPLVYVTFGSVAAQFGFFPGVYRAAIDALAGIGARVLVTTGHAADLDALGPVPANVHVERWVPQADVLPHVAAMVCHGGFGTVRAGLCAGVPLAVAPLFADQPYNARRVAELGAGIALEGGPAAIAGLGPAVRALLDEPSYCARAAEVAADARTLPPVRDAVAALESLAALPA
jgi:UDP:flavonoid glycosyltransferase YjiC (YdhE family)